jgi:hypothetical protein
MDKKQTEDFKQFDEFLKKYEGVVVPDFQEFKEKLVTFQEKLYDFKKLPLEERQQMCSYMIEHKNNFQELLQIAILSVLAYFLDGGKYVGEMLKLVRKSKLLVEENKYFIYGQINSYSFVNKDYIRKEDAWEKRMLYRDIYQGFKKALGVTKQMVPVEKRNQKVVVFFVSQFLNPSHGPSKTVMDRCMVIAQQMGAECVIINTAELCCMAGYIPFFAPIFGNYSSKLSEVDKILYQGNIFSYHQCSNTMPNLDELMQVILLVKKLNPYCLFQVGGGSVCADLCSNFYPLITVGTVPSSIAVTEGQFVLTGKQITDCDREYVAQLEFSENYLQSCLFTSSINPQIGKATRHQYGIPDDVFTILIVGGRLADEVTEEFIERALLPVMEQEVFAVFMGVFDTYQERCEKYPLLRTHSVYTGFVEDVLSVNEICDVYVNPQRHGGGTSVVEAMEKKLPPVTLHYGDVALGTGEDFWVEDYEAMVRQILRLKEDAVFYRRMSEKAYKRMKVLTDSAGVFWECFQKIKTFPEFQ